MATFKTFEQIDAWQKSRELTKQVYRIAGQGTFSRDYGLKDQIRRAGVSVMSNIAVGFERSGTGEFTQFLATAKGSAGEVRSQLYVALDQAYLRQEEFDTVSSDAIEVSRMLSGLMTYFRGSGIKGTKYKKLE
jgi:four helix bundle protein